VNEPTTDAEKLAAYGAALMTVPRPELVDPEAQQVLADALTDLAAIVDRLAVFGRGEEAT
jgi:hypothetical protein